MSIERFSWDNKIIVVMVRQVSELNGVTQLKLPKIANTGKHMYPQSMRGFEMSMKVKRAAAHPRSRAAGMQGAAALR